jgi:hypothetical protein
MGNVPKNAPMTHIDNPAPPTAAKSTFSSRKKIPAKLNPIRVSETATVALNRLRHHLDAMTFFDN